MKLLATYSRINLVVTIVIFLVSGIAYYLLLSFILVMQIDDDLKIEEEEITTYVIKHDRLPEIMSVNDQLISFLPESGTFNKRYFSTENIVTNKEKEDYRQLAFGITAAGQHYKVSVSKSLEDTDALIHSILLITFLTILAILIASFIINRLVLKRIWQPFYNTLELVKSFKLGETEKFQLPENKVEEFGLMNNTIVKLIKQAQLDYLSLKTFSENASHEIQTPLAVIRSKLDILVQDDDLTEQQSKSLLGVYAAVEKLTRLNHSLLLLTKIENNQFAEKRSINIKQQLEEKLAEFHELWQSQQIMVHCNFGEKKILMNEELLEILLNNLLSNATKYNHENGNIGIDLTSDKLVVSNTSDQPPLDQQQIFKRFYKVSNDQHQNGLGLSIIRQICDDTGFTVNYSFKNASHFFTIKW
ncbi:N/A [soil metagenome]